MTFFSRYLSISIFFDAREDEFTCNDGQCIPMRERCDQLPDCRNLSFLINNVTFNSKYSFFQLLKNRKI